LKNQVYEGERYELSPDFLMEMMEINEGIMELKTDPDAEMVSAYRNQVEGLKNELYENVRDVIEHYDDGQAGEETLKKIKDYYYKKKYLLRIQQSLDTFGARENE
jgi:molecular chaperone HscB